MYFQVHPGQSATDFLVAGDPENELGNNKPPVPTYAASELLPATSGLAPKLAELKVVTNVPAKTMLISTWLNPELDNRFI